jgi:hypothetical protein
MALMKWREPNQAKWIGFRPAHNGTPIIITGNYVSGANLLYTVSPNKTLHICHSWGMARANTTNELEMYVKTAAGTLMFFLGCCGSSPGGSSGNFSNVYPETLEIASGCLIYMEVTVLVGTVWGGFDGWEE